MNSASERCERTSERTSEWPSTLGVLNNPANSDLVPRQRGRGEEGQRVVHRLQVVEERVGDALAEGLHAGVEEGEFGGGVRERGGGGGKELVGEGGEGVG